jgi:acyl-CoA synthetase (AMP-forming)/AMP-acid ligase II
VPPAAPGDEPVRWLFFTSGTTADPKGARHTDATIACGGAAVVERFAITERDRYPIVFPFTHIGGIGMLVAQLMTGAGAIAVEQYDPEASPALFARHGLTIAAGGTPMALLYLQAQRRQPGTPLFPALRVAMTGAAPKPPTLDAELRAELGGIGSVSVYGLTEAPFATAGSVADPPEWQATTEGRVIPGCELRIVDAAGRLVPTGTTGEICIRGPLLCKGYLDEARNADAFDADGFFHSGDLGSVDEHGNLTVSGRLKDVIIRKGENISAKEVEDVCYEHPDVVDVAVIGLPDPERGERACAVVVLRDGAPRIDVAALGAHCRAAGLAPQKIPEQVEIVDVLPRNASGKILKYRLQETYR